MNSNKYNEKLSHCTKAIIEEQLDYLKLKNAINDLKILFEEVSEIDFHHPSAESHVFLKSGKAIGSKWAGMCVDDFMRTKRFVTGLYKAVRDTLQKNKNNPVHILYAGTGPFATLVMPLTTIFKPSELQFTLLEVNPKSLENLKKTIKNLEVESYVNEIHQCDATEFIIPTPNTIDIVLIECMQHALVKEPQVAITFNLMQQLDKDVILIPEQISLYVSLINSSKKLARSLDSENSKDLEFYKKVKNVFTLNKQEALKNKSSTFNKEKILFTNEQLTDFDTLAITTEITVYKEEKLEIDNSGLTIPLLLTNLSNDNLKGLTTQYIINEQPGLSFEFLR